MAEIYDIAIIGAGPAGANAALTASEQGCRVVVIDEQSKAGGQVWRVKSAAIAKAPDTPETVAGNALRDALSISHAVHMSDTQVWQIEREADDWAIYVLAAGRSRKIMSRALVLASGAREFVQPVPGWTTPGVVGLAGATALIKQDMTLPGQRTVVSGTGPLVFFVASEVRRHGGTVAAIVTPNHRTEWLRAMPFMAARPDLLWRGSIWIADLMLARVPIFWGYAVSEVSGGDTVTSVEVCKLGPYGAPIGRVSTIHADSVCLGNGLIPAIEAAQLAGVPLEHRPDLGGWVPRADSDGKTSIAGLFVCGDSAGIRGAAAAEIHGKLAGLSACAFVGKGPSVAPVGMQRRYARAARFGMAMTALSIPKPGSDGLTTPQTIMCRCESLTRDDITTEIAAGAQSSNAVKSGLRAGMGPCGGKFCQSAIARLIAKTEGRPETDVPPPTPRPPLRPVPTAALAGDFDYADLPIPKPAPL
ncbi:NAD(P)/FAD-dependent oxidoreductase [Ruegeria sp. EL01]|jgi:thioredoxin reductase/bacterioferritin-associated ferredoxin|uniref:NAD(P)/FAD-dependent oxidoreductase n=1 Tax=Ruegeria sp. EL01 TaxID=2107578 RepID=UPI000EA7F6CC|nr:NAD(P)/FAD-dependent oxidoreductase [Ruegeria sp. EL01]